VENATLTAIVVYLAGTVVNDTFACPVGRRRCGAPPIGSADGFLPDNEKSYMRSWLYHLAARVKPYGFGMGEAGREAAGVEGQRPRALH
jgi:hypothetical protein